MQKDTCSCGYADLPIDDEGRNDNDAVRDIVYGVRQEDPSSIDWCMRVVVVCLVVVVLVGEYVMDEFENDHAGEDSPS